MHGSPLREARAASLILLGGKIWTGSGGQPEAEAVAVSGERVVAVGEYGEVKTLAGAETRTIDLAGSRVIPGLSDGHLHVLGGGLLLSRVDLRDAESEEDFEKRLVEYAKGLPAGNWVLGGNWDEERALGGRLPERELLDRLIPDRPTFIRRYDGHMAACNSRALEAAGVGPSTKDPPGGVIDRDPHTGRPTGILRDAGIELVLAKVPKPGESEIARAVESALQEVSRSGLTAADDMGGDELTIRAATIRAYARLAEEGRLPVRISFFLPLAGLDEMKELRDISRPHLRFAGLKAFYDGSLGARTALMFEPYDDAPETCGLRTTPRGVMEPLLLRADAEGLVVSVHAIGDRAIHEVLDIFDEVRRKNGPRERRPRVEHAQHLRRDDIPRFNGLGVIASMQPRHAADDGRFAEKRLGKERCRTSFAWNSLLDSGGRVVFGSDWPVAPLNPFLGIDAAVTRRTTDGCYPEGWFPEESITVEEAVRAYTSGAAYATFSEAERGTIEPGKLADMVVLSRDIMKPEEKGNIAETDVLMSVVGGKLREFG